MLNNTTPLQWICRQINPKNLELSYADVELDANYKTLIDWHRLHSQVNLAKSKRESRGIELLEKAPNWLKKQSKQDQVIALEHKKLLIKIDGLLKAQKIEFLVIKGITLGELGSNTFYPRHSKDIDIWVKEEEAQKTIDTLIEGGLRLIHPSCETSLLSKQHMDLEKDAVLLMRSSLGLIEVEIHWRLDKNKFAYDLSFEECFERSQTFSIARYSFKTLSNQDYFNYLLLHGSLALWGRLKWLHDFERHLARLEDQSNQFNWRKNEEKLIDSGQKRSLAIVHRLLLFYFGHGLPSGLTQTIESKRLFSISNVVTKLCIRYNAKAQYPPLLVRWMCRWLLIQRAPYRREHLRLALKKILLR